MTNDINMLALRKRDDVYLFYYSDANRAKLLRTLGRFASNGELNFTWYDAAVLSLKVREEKAKAEKCQSRFPS